MVTKIHFARPNYTFDINSFFSSLGLTVQERRKQLLDTIVTVEEDLSMQALSALREAVKAAVGSFPGLSGDYLGIKKFNRLYEIDKRTEELIKAGFSWNGELFSLSVHAQLKWTGLRLSLQTGDLGPQDFPMLVPNKYDTAQYNISDKFEAENMYLTAVGTVKAHVGGGEGLKQSVRAATTAEEVDAVVDTR